MLVKIIRFPQVKEPLELDSGFDAFLSPPVLPALKEEHFIHLHAEFKVFYIDVHTKRCAGFSADFNCPHNAIAVIQHGPSDSVQTVFIKEDEEAYIISEAGNTITVVSSPKQRSNSVFNHKSVHLSAQNPVPPASTISGP